jgi:hypothetical protein
LVPVLVPVLTIVALATFNDPPQTQWLIARRPL